MYFATEFTVTMIITELQQLYAAHPNRRHVQATKNNSVRHLYCSGLCASTASLFSSVLVQRAECLVCLYSRRWKKPGISITT